MNDHEAQRIAAAAHELRPDWPTSSVLTLIRKNLIDKPRRDVSVAFAWIACESNTATPARVLETGPWWRAAGVDGATSKREQVDPARRCTACSRHEDDAMHPADHAYSRPHEKPSPEVVAERVAALKAEVVPTAGPTERRSLDDMAAANPELHARVEAVRAANPGLQSPPMREPDPTPVPTPDETEPAIEERA